MRLDEGEDYAWLFAEADRRLRRLGPDKHNLIEDVAAWWVGSLRGKIREEIEEIPSKADLVLRHPITFLTLRLRNKFFKAQKSASDHATVALGALHPSDAPVAHIDTDAREFLIAVHADLRSYAERGETEQRDVLLFELQKIEGWSYEELALHFDLDESRVKDSLRKIREHLLRQFGPNTPPTQPS